MTRHPELSLDSLNSFETCRSIAFISARPGDGATTATIAAAHSMIEHLSERVVVADLNIRHPSLHKIFDVPLSPGISDILRNSNIPEEDITHKAEENLSIITFGSENIPFRKESVLKNFQTFMVNLKDDFDHVLFDICPVIQEPSMNRMISLFDGVILIIACETTTWEVAQHLKEKLESAGANLLGAILNKRRYYIPKWLYKSL